MIMFVTVKTFKDRRFLTEQV